MINEKVQNVLNAQINKEFYSAYLYLAMSAFLTKLVCVVFRIGPKFRQEKKLITE